MTVTSKVALVFGSGQIARALYQMEKGEWKVILAPHSLVDIRDFAGVKAVVQEARASIVINAAAFTSVERAEALSKECYSVNSDGPANIAQAAAAADLPMLHISSDYVFDGSKIGPYTELDSPKPKNVYGSSKFSGEQKIQEILESYIVLRTSWVFASEGANFLNKMVSLIREGHEVKVVDDQIGCPTPAVCVAKVLLNLAEKIMNGKNDWGVYHYCGLPKTSWYGFAKSIFLNAEERGVKVPKLTGVSSNEYKDLVDRPRKVVMECTRIKDIWGIEQPDWRPRVPEYLGLKWPEGNLEK